MRRATTPTRGPGATARNTITRDSTDEAAAACRPEVSAQAGWPPTATSDHPGPAQGRPPCHQRLSLFRFTPDARERDDKRAANVAAGDGADLRHPLCHGLLPHRASHTDSRGYPPCLLGHTLEGVPGGGLRQSPAAVRPQPSDHPAA